MHWQSLKKLFLKHTPSSSVLLPSSSTTTPFQKYAHTRKRENNRHHSVPFFFFQIFCHFYFLGALSAWSQVAHTRNHYGAEEVSLTYVTWESISCARNDFIASYRASLEGRVRKTLCDLGQYCQGNNTAVKWWKLWDEATIRTVSGRGLLRALKPWEERRCQCSQWAMQKGKGADEE